MSDAERQQESHHRGGCLHSDEITDSAGPRSKPRESSEDDAGLARKIEKLRKARVALDQPITSLAWLAPQFAGARVFEQRLLERALEGRRLGSRSSLQPQHRAQFATKVVAHMEDMQAWTWGVQWVRVESSTSGRKAPRQFV